MFSITVYAHRLSIFCKWFHPDILLVISRKADFEDMREQKSFPTHGKPPNLENVNAEKPLYVDYTIQEASV